MSGSAHVLAGKDKCGDRRGRPQFQLRVVATKNAVLLGISGGVCVRLQETRQELGSVPSVPAFPAFLQNSYLKHVEDQCANTANGCADGHMDDYSATQQCSGVTDLQGSPYWTVDDQ